MQGIRKNACGVHGNTVHRTCTGTFSGINRAVQCLLPVLPSSALRRHVVSHKLSTFRRNLLPPPCTLNTEQVPTNRLWLSIKLNPIISPKTIILKLTAMKASFLSSLQCLYKKKASTPRFFQAIFQFKTVNYTKWLGRVTYGRKGKDSHNLCLYTYHTQGII
jgi:hypothetical protein